MSPYRVRVRRGSASIYDRRTGETFFWRDDPQLVRSVCRDLNAAVRAVALYPKERSPTKASKRDERAQRTAKRTK